MQRPTSATHYLVATMGLATYVATAVAVRLNRPFGNDVVHSALLIIALTTACIFLVDIGWQKVHRRASTGLDFDHDDPSWRRTFIKLVGLLASVGLVAFCYWLSPEYSADGFGNYYRLLRIIVPPWLVLAIPYFFWVDRKMPEPRDGYWHLGKLVTLQRDAVDLRIVGQHILGWVIKGYFLPLMFTYMCGDLKFLFLLDLDTLTSFKNWFGFLYRFVFFVDVGLAALGYLMSFRLTDSHIRSAEPTMLGWVVTVVCYEPLWTVFTSRYLAYDTGYPWDTWLANRPVLFAVWGSGILLLSAIYAWATVMFGARFSNLTHRGIITSGPYRWTKHPAYVAKSLSWWMIAVPFMPKGAPEDAVYRCLLLLVLNFIYVMRAKTEEWHLSRDPDYVRYALWMEEHGIFRLLKHVPVLRHLGFQTPPKQASVVGDSGPDRR